MPIEWLNLSGRIAIVTGGGANGGNGHAIALELAKAGADIFVTDRDRPGAEATAREIEALGRRAVPFTCDNRIPDQILASYVLFDREFSHLDILVNNVAAGIRKRPESVTLDEWQGVMRVILDGTFIFTREAGIRMIRQGKGGSIVNISSIAGSSALGRGNFVYSVAKGGINQFTRELAVEWSPHGIRVNAIQPAQIMTPAVKRMFDDPRLDPKSLEERLLRG